MKQITIKNSQKNILRGLATFLVIAPAILTFLVHGYVIQICTTDRQLRRWRLILNVSRYSRFALKIMRVSIEAHRVEVLKGSKKNCLMVCNHMSYLDMMVLSSVAPATFVTSVDMGQVFFLGTMAEIGGSLFIERRHRERLSGDIGRLQETLSQGFNVMLFPEGTSSDGSGILPFKRSLLVSAAQAGCPILPITLKYEKVEGQFFGPSNSDIVCWYGSKAFAPHFFRLLSASSVHASVKFHEFVDLNDPQDKHVVAESLYHTIAAEYKSQGGESNGFHQHGKEFV